MSKKLNNEEIQKRIIAIFRESGSFFQLKEIETAGKEKGLLQKDIKPVVLSLVDEDIIKTNKIGTSSYYWIESLVKDIEVKIKQLDTIKARNKELHEKLEGLDEKVEQMNKEVINGLYFCSQKLIICCRTRKKMNLSKLSVLN